MIVNQKTFDCHHGIDRNAKKKEQKKLNHLLAL